MKRWLRLLVPYCVALPSRAEFVNLVEHNNICQKPRKVFAYSRSEAWCWNAYDGTEIELERKLNKDDYLRRRHEVVILPYTVFSDYRPETGPERTTSCCDGTTRADIRKHYNSSAAAGEPYQYLRATSPPPGEEGHCWEGYRVPFWGLSPDANYNIEWVCFHDDAEKQFVRLSVHNTGWYILGFAGCCHPKIKPCKPPATSIRIQYPCGYLPGDQAVKLPLYRLATILYLFICGAWVVLCVQRCQWLCGIQKCLTIALALAAFECFALWCYYYVWNLLEHRKEWFWVAFVVRICRVVFSFTIALMGSMGWGVTRPALPRVAEQQLCLVGTSFFIFLVAAQLADTRGSGEEVPTDLQQAEWQSVIVGSPKLFKVGIYFWMVVSVHYHHRVLCPVSDEDKLAFFRSFWRMLQFTGGCVVLAMMADTMWRWRPLERRERMWKYEWLFKDTDIRSSLFFQCSLAILLWYFAPCAETYRYSYSAGRRARTLGFGPLVAGHIPDLDGTEGLLYPDHDPYPAQYPAQGEGNEALLNRPQGDIELT